jgi:hypothetical protein
LGIGDWAQSPIPNPQSPIPNPQSPIPIYFFKMIEFYKLILNINQKNKIELNSFKKMETRYMDKI